MHNERRTTRAMCVLALGAFVLAGCNLDGLFGGDRARVRVALSSDNGSASAALVASETASNNGGDDGERGDHSRLSSMFTSAQVTLSSVMFRNLDGELTDAHMDLPVTVDVVKIEDGRQVVLPDGSLPPGTYDQVVIVMTAVAGTLRDGTKVTIQPPGGGWTAVVPICSLQMAEGQTQTVGVTLQVRNSFLQSRDHWSFQPRFRAQADCD